MIQLDSSLSGKLEIIEVTIPVTNRLKGVLEHFAIIASKSLPQFVIEQVLDVIEGLCDEPGMINVLIKDHVYYMDELQHELDEWNGSNNSKRNQKNSLESHSMPEFDAFIKVIIPETFLNDLEVFLKVTNRKIEGMLRECLMMKLNDINEISRPDDLLPFITLDIDSVNRLREDVSLVKEQVNGNLDDIDVQD